VSKGETALIESAQAMGMAQVPEGGHNPATSTSRGMGELILEALDLGIRDFIITLGGSATNDGGFSMAQALGVRFLSSDGIELADGGINLRELAHIDVSNIDSRLKECEFLVLCDAGVPLTGETGVSLMFSEGKGASPETASQLDAALINFSSIVNEELGVDLADVRWAGAAGGLASSLVVFLHGELKLGVEVTLDAVNLPDSLIGADLVITGEGSVDEQTIFDKAPIGVARLANKHGIPVIAVCATVGKEFEKVFDHGIDAVVAVAGRDGWTQGEIVFESDIAEATRDIMGQISEGATLRAPSGLMLRSS
jgi:glycerate kinase